MRLLCGTEVPLRRLVLARTAATRPLRHLTPQPISITGGRELFEMAVILVVEDDVFIREMAASMIQDWGHQVLSACDVPEALAHIRSGSNIDALFTDIYLKAEIHGGCDVAREAIWLRPRVRVLYTTANRVTDKLRTLFTAGAHFLPKPYTEEQLGASVQNLLAA
jgi:CheY-like chemotaxis protein